MLGRIKYGTCNLVKTLSGKVNRGQGARRQSDCLHDFTSNDLEIENMMIFDFENFAEV